MFPKEKTLLRTSLSQTKGKSARKTRRSGCPDSKFSKDVLKAFELAKEVRLHAHAPYSRYKVGAVVKAKSSKLLLAGCNVENAAFPAGVCAETSAVSQMVARTPGPPSGPLEFVVVVSDNKKGASICGVCRQVLSEFSDDKTAFYLANLIGIQKVCTIDEILPGFYSTADLKERTR